MRSLKIFALLATLNMGAWIIPQEAFARQGGISFGVFYDELSPYGQWVDYPGYGYVWIPSTGSEFAPYSTNGHWILTDYGWTWVSDYSWGWAPFHYGRWDYDDSYGWFWVPDNEWGPSWVNWRRADGYYGWSPMRPGISISVSFGSGYTVPNDRWIFVRDRDFSRTNINHYYINRTNNSTIIKNSSVINRTYTDQNRHSTYVSGPDKADVQKNTGRTIQSAVIHDNEKPGQNLRNGQLQIYRPQVQMNDENGRRTAPSRLVNLKDVKRPSERNTANPIPNVKLVNNNKQKIQSVQSSDVKPANTNRQKIQPVQQSNIKSADNNRKKNQPVQPSIINPVNKNNKNRPLQQHTIVPLNNKRNQQPSRSVNPPRKDPPPQPRDVNPPNGIGKEKQPQNVAPSNKIDESQHSQPKVNEGEKEQRKRE